ncbi:hypothetical protein Tco_1408258 [Tanacetum coccineum]
MQKRMRGNLNESSKVKIIKRRRQDLHRNGVRDLAMASGCGQLKEDLESSMWRCKLVIGFPKCDLDEEAAFASDD